MEYYLLLFIYLLWSIINMLKDKSFSNASWRKASPYFPLGFILLYIFFYFFKGLSPGLSNNGQCLYLKFFFLNSVLKESWIHFRLLLNDKYNMIRLLHGKTKSLSALEQIPIHFAQQIPHTIMVQLCNFVQFDQLMTFRTCKYLGRSLN